jgi:tetratricopeptide (TPR) repeat protein
MALRLTATTPVPASTGPSPSTMTAAAFSATARAALGRSDIAAFAELFGQIAQTTDPHRRFEARLGLMQAGFEATSRLGDAVSLRIFLTLAEQAIELLEESPAEPVLLNLAGVALYELWGLDAAHALFSAARRLDPELPDAERNLAQVAARRRAGRRTRPLHASLPGLSRRATSVARRAQPARGLTLSLCMIVRDEEQMLGRCLAAAAPAVDEIIVVDTGSTDSTIEIARSFGARVIEFPWTGSFSEARNVSFEAASGDWLIYLDADEILVAEDRDRLRAITGRTWREAFYLVETNYLGELGEGTATVNTALRVFRNRPEYRFTNQLHEQIYKTLPSYLPMRIEQTTIRVEHYGYLGAVRTAKDKSRRNIELLLEEASGSDASAFHHFNLGSEYLITGELDASVRELRRAREMLDEQGVLRSTIYAPPLWSRLVSALYLSGRGPEAATVAAEALQALPDFTDIVLDQARGAHAAGELTRSRELFDRCIEMGDAPAAYGGIVGAGTFWPMLGLAAIGLAEGDVSGARVQVERCMAEHPGFLTVVVPYTTILLTQGADVTEILAGLESLGQLPGSARLAVGETMRRFGEREGAVAQYQLAVDAAPGNAAARCTLAELLLETGRFDEAAEAVAPVPDSGPFAGLARRVALIASIGRVDAAEARSLLARAEAVGLPPGEQSVFAHWIALTAGEAVTAIGANGAALLTVILETLLAAGDGVRFTGLLEALQGCRLADREKRERLATMYLRNGLIDRAAEQWMAACVPAPDARALLGLARVAAAGGMPSDATTFATGALELDPAIPGAAELLAAVPAAAIAR